MRLTLGLHWAYIVLPTAPRTAQGRKVFPLNSTRFWLSLLLHSFPVASSLGSANGTDMSQPLKVLITARLHLISITPARSIFSDFPWRYRIVFGRTGASLRETLFIPPRRSLKIVRRDWRSPLSVFHPRPSSRNHRVRFISWVGKQS